MAKETHDDIFLGTDFERVFHIKNEDESAAINILGWAISWMVKRHKDQSDLSASLTKTTGLGHIVIAGSYNSDPAVNTQRATLTVADTDTDTAISEGLYHWELKRTDAGFEVVLDYGTLECVQGVHR